MKDPRIDGLAKVIVNYSLELQAGQTFFISSGAVAERGWLPVPLFCAGGIATPADASLTMQLGAEGNFVGSGIFKSADPERTAKAVVEATTHFEDPERVLAASTDLGDPMRGDDIAELAAEGELLQQRGW